LLERSFLGKEGRALSCYIEKKERKKEMAHQP
jgi:hypothetical protein